MHAGTFLEQSMPFIKWMLNWRDSLAPASLSALVDGRPESIGIVCVDVINGFCTVGPLSSHRVKNIIEPIASLFQIAWDQGIRDIALPSDAHPEDAVEFNQYGVHCVRGTEEARVVEEFQALPFFGQMTVIEKNSINSGLNTEFANWLAERVHIHTWIVVGDCTDICTYQLAMHLRISANENQQTQTRVILPMNAVDTYDLPVAIAKDLGIIPHNGDFLHLVFLYHMMLNGVEIYTQITE